MKIETNLTAEAITIPSGAAVPAAGNAIDMRQFIVGMVETPAAWTSASMGFKGSQTKDGAFVPLRNEAGSLIEITGIVTNAAGRYRLPLELAACHFIIPWSESSGSDANQAADRALIFHLKG